MSVMDHEALGTLLRAPFVEPANNAKLVQEPEVSKPLAVKSPYKFKEHAMVAEGVRHIEATYGQHYVDPTDNIQVLDILKAIGAAEDFCRGNAIKYLCRYGKKDGYNRSDLLKAFHYLVLLMYFTENK